MTAKDKASRNRVLRRMLADQFKVTVQGDDEAGLYRRAQEVIDQNASAEGAKKTPAQKAIERGDSQ